VLTRASLADALAYALGQLGADIVAREGAGSEYR
jgi:rsbT co-antagonist protein RsbR